MFSSLTSQTKPMYFLEKVVFWPKSTKKLGILEADKISSFQLSLYKSLIFYSLDFLGCGPFDLNSSINGREILKKSFTSFSTKNFVKTNKPFITALVTS